MANHSVTESLANWVRAFDADAVPADARGRLKLSVLDAIGCAFLGRASDITAPVIAAIGDLGSGGPCTVIGGNASTTVQGAVLVNASLIRALDFNDHQAIDPNDGQRLGGHPSDVLAVALAVGEWQGNTGAEVLEAALLGYEIYGRAQKVLGRGHSWDHVTAHGLTAPAVAGKLLGLTQDGLADALSLGAAHGTTVGAVRRGALSSAKFLAAPMVLGAGTTAALLASHGVSGPRTVFEDGEKGLCRQVYTGGEPATLSAPLSRRPMIEGVTIKAYPGLDTSQAPITAVLEARRAHGGPIEEIDGVTLSLTSNPMVQRQIEDAALKRPANRETADHSLYYLAAAALLEGEVTEAQYARALWEDARIKDLMGRITLEMDPDWETRAPDAFPCAARITTKTGEMFGSEVLYAPGHARNPLDAAGVVAKFRRSVAGLLDDARAGEIVAQVDALDELSSIDKLMATLAA
jgi:2-methylcitrate dehydratase